MSIEAIQSYARNNLSSFQEELKDLIRIPSISSSPTHKDDVRKCALILKEKLSGLGFEKTEIIDTKGHPIVYAEWLKAKGKPTVLLYAHYDVQPVDPLHLWDNPPFEPVIKDDRIYGRGTADDKGQLVIHLKALESWFKVNGSLPVNVKVIFEGEEEIGSENLHPFLKENKEMLSADYAVISDTSMIKKGVPSICYGLRGLIYFQINVRGSKQDLHSGSFGGSVKNPIHAISEIISRLKDENGHITIPGVYDDVNVVSEEERNMMSSLPFDEQNYTKEVGARQLYHEKGYSVLESLWCRPTVEVCGIWGGFSGEGSKTVIPAEAHAKISMRLVANQKAEKIAKLFEEYIKKISPPEVSVEVVGLHGGEPYLGDIRHPAFQAAKNALKDGFGVEPVFIREGGSIPFVQSLYEELHTPCLLLGFGLPDENAHAPNEWLDLENFEKGIYSCISLYNEIGKI